MASKRMINISVVDSDAFLSLPATAQNLYFHLNMRADDDGFIDSPKKIMRIVGASDGDMQQLLQKRYLIAFESGVLVIKHWRMHNTLQSDRKISTNYQEELSQLVLQKNKTYTEKDNPKFKLLEDNSILETNRKHNGSDVLPQYRLDKIRLDQNSIDIEQEDNVLDMSSSSPVDVRQEKEIRNKSKNKDIFETYSDNHDLTSALMDYARDRKARKKPMSDRAKTIFLNKLDGLASSDEKKIQLIDEAILRGWNSVYEINTNSYQNKNTKSIEFVDYNHQVTQSENNDEILKDIQAMLGGE